MSRQDLSQLEGPALVVHVLSVLQILVNNEVLKTKPLYYHQEKTYKFIEASTTLKSYTYSHVWIFRGLKKLAEWIVSSKELSENLVWVSMEDIAPREPSNKISSGNSTLQALFTKLVIDSSSVRHTEYIIGFRYLGDSEVRCWLV